MFEYKCTICGEMKIAPLNIFALRNFVCNECKEKEEAKS